MGTQSQRYQRRRIRLMDFLTISAPAIMAAKRWRREQGCEGHGGVVIVYGSIGAGWVDGLRNPEHWEPGVIAVDEAGHTWLAVGGDASTGAAAWMPTNKISWCHTKNLSRRNIFP